MKKKVLIIVSHFLTIYSLRKELIDKLLENEYEVYISLPDTPETVYFKEKGCHIIDTEIERRNTNPLNDFLLLKKYVEIHREIKPDVTLTYTIKPNIYGGIAAKITNTKVLHTVTGIGSVYINNLKIKGLVKRINRVAFKNVQPIIFLNDDNAEFYKKLEIIQKDQDYIIVPGSGVNLMKFGYSELPLNHKLKFTFIGRIIKDKGIEEFLTAAKIVKFKYPFVEFEVIGFVDDMKYKETLDDYVEKGYIKYLGNQKDVYQFMKESTCIVLPSYGEGRGTVLQEGAAVGRPLITCDTFGCKENVDNGINGFLSKVGDAKSLAENIEKIIQMDPIDRVEMGKASREKAENEFDRELVMKVYMREINKMMKR